MLRCRESWLIPLKHYRRQSLFRWVARQIRVDFRPPNWQAFWKTTVDGLSPQRVAKDCGMSIAAVYTAKSRVLARLRDELERMHQEEFADF